MKHAFCAVLLLSIGFSACAAEKNNLHVSDAWVRATPVVAPVAGGFMTVTNAGKHADRLLRIESDDAARVELHETRNENGVFRMRQRKDGIPIAAHATLELKPGGSHLMWIQPKHPPTAGSSYRAVLVFEHAGAIPVTFVVRATKP